VVVCVDSTLLDASFSGREYDASFLADLPSAVDPCGENGEFHTFVYDGPLFRERVKFSIGETVVRDERFVYTDLVP
jgi:diphthamide synthase (EF-2-diphthine--ammonia ligase)